MSCPTEITVDSEESIIQPEVTSSEIQVTETNPVIQPETIKTVLLPNSTPSEISVNQIDVILEHKCSQGPAGPAGTSNVPDSFTVIVPASSTVLLDSVLFSTICSGKWFLSIKDSTNDLIKNLEVSGNSKVSGEVTWVVADVFGDSISTAISLTNTLGSLELSLTNNTLFDLVVKGTRLSIFQ